MSEDGAENLSDNPNGTQALEISNDSEASENTGTQPTVLPARRRAQIVPVSNEAETAAENTSISHRAIERTPGEPPPFSGTLQLEPKDLKQFQKALKTHKKCSNMKKLTFLDYFVMRFSEIAYFEVEESSGGLRGVLGYGNIQLVTLIKDQLIGEAMFPSIFGVLAENECFVGPVESLREEDLQALTEIGFSATQFVGAFPITYKKAVTGLWICTSSDPVEMDAKEVTAVKKQLTNFIL